MAEQLNGRRVAFLVANEGVERVELTSPWEAVSSAGGQPVLIAPKLEPVQTFDHLDPSETYDAEQSRSTAA